MLRITDIQNGDVNWDTVPGCDCTAEDLRKHALRPGDILFARTGATTGKTFLISSCPENAVFASYLIRVRLSEAAWPAYVAHYLDSPGYWSQITSTSNGTAQPGVNASKLASLKIPLPPVSEQKRIAAILDKANEICRKRKQALKAAADLLLSAFVYYFGECWIRGGGHAVRFNDMLSAGLRNGVSPAAGGTIPSQVLTLAAVTNRSFNPSATKEGMFASVPSPDKFVSRDDFLICRGNGNLSLVGTAKFPTTNMPDTVFPDTIIAASVNLSVVDSRFLEFAWQSPYLRRQIERGARTTNGTHKINQTTVENLMIPCPPLTAQRRFGALCDIQREITSRFEDVCWQALYESLKFHVFRRDLR
jgi:type I restriction enzyme S subunit